MTNDDPGALPFSTVADLLGVVTCRIRPSVNAAYQAKVKEMGVSIKAVYDELSGVEPNVARAAVRETSLEMAAIIEQTGGTRPVPLPNYRIKIVDGNHLRRTERRLGELRDKNVAPLHAVVGVVKSFLGDETAFFVRELKSAHPCSPKNRWAPQLHRLWPRTTDFT
jgi:hypothetical protein